MRVCTFEASATLLVLTQQQRLLLLWPRDRWKQTWEKSEWEKHAGTEGRRDKAERLFFYRRQNNIFSTVLQLHQTAPFVSVSYFRLCYTGIKMCFVVMAHNIYTHIYIKIWVLTHQAPSHLSLIKSLPTPLPLQPCSISRILSQILCKPQHESNKEKVVAVCELWLLHGLHPAFLLLFPLHLMAFTTSEWMSSSPPSSSSISFLLPL